MLSGFSTWLLAAGGGLVLLIVIWLQGRLSGAKAERNANRAKEADAYEKHLQDIADAANAGNSVRPSDSLLDDPYNRDRR